MSILSRLSNFYMTKMDHKTNSEPPAADGVTRTSPMFSLEQLKAMGIPIGTFGGSHDFVVRIRNGALVAANAGTQGGGQN
jgi:hypothetical protein